MADDSAARQREILMFSALAQTDEVKKVEDSGTFAPSSKVNKEPSNLEAAAAALASDLPGAAAAPDAAPATDSSLPFYPRAKRQSRDLPMYNEQVYLPRPLFFGPHLPPRVIEEAQEIVDKVSSGHEQPPSVSDMPPEVRNLVSTIRVYGYGLSAIDKGKKASSFVSVFSPVWGETARAERDERCHPYREDKDPPDVPKEEEETVEPRARLDSSEQDLFLQWARGEPPESNNDSFQSGTHADMSNADQSFLQWAQGAGEEAGSSSNLLADSADKDRQVQAVKPDVKDLEGGHGTSGKTEGVSDTASFLQWARGDSPVNTEAGGPLPHREPESNVKKGKYTFENQKSDTDSFLQWARGDSPVDDTTAEVSQPNRDSESEVKKSDADSFLKWARGDAPVNRPTETTEQSQSRREAENQSFMKWAQGEVAPVADQPSEQQSETADFLKWATADHQADLVEQPSGKGSKAQSMDREGERRLETESLPKLAQQSQHDNDNLSKQVEMQDTDNFLNWARGDPPSEETKQQSETDSFLKWAQQDTPHAPSTSKSREESDNESFLKWARQDPPSEEPAAASETQKGPAPMSDQDLFSQWARGEDSGGGGSSKAAAAYGSLVPTKSEPVSSGTFLAVTRQDDSDDDSVVGSELKTKVGINEHLNAALASLAGDVQQTGETSLTAEENETILAQPVLGPGGRPLTNLELTNGMTPFFGIDDSALPVETDLGIYETKDEQQRGIEERRSQEIIEKHVAPNVFGQICCPNPAMNPDDFHTWNSRSGFTTHEAVGPPSVHSTFQDRSGSFPFPAKTPPKVREPLAASPSTNIQRSPLGPGNMPPSVSQQKASLTGVQLKGSIAPRRLDSHSRLGWWNIPEKNDPLNGQPLEHESRKTDSESDPLQLPPMDHSSLALQVEVGLEPNPDKLREKNAPLSESHPATPLAQCLPYIADRPPSHRYLQIDTQAVGFPPLGGEIEPMFCSLAIYHVDTVASRVTDPAQAPVPDMQRCGRVTETLCFDVVSESDTEERCREALWPYRLEDEPDKPGNEPTQGTRCGIFPIPSNLNVSNLYAILIVHKVLSSHSDLDVYVKPSKFAGAEKGKEKVGVDVSKYKTKASKASRKQGQFLLPFAFGVAPLLQVFGAKIPVIASSRAVQIPLFRFVAGKGERQILDHIMVMLYPRANHRASGINGPAAVTNGGTAMLVMRNFGYLGLHSIVHNRSSLARDRVVDFTGELQFRRREEDDPAPDDDWHKSGPPSFVDPSRVGVDFAPSWHQKYVTEFTVCGGRNAADTETSGPGSSTTNRDVSRCHLYAQELAPVPLQLKSTTRHSTPATSGLVPQRGGATLDSEPYFHTSFCNELLCHPRLLRGAPKGYIVVKVEIREMEWSPLHSAYFASFPQTEPSIHNPRRGPFLVREVFTSCAAKCRDPWFMDEFKIKLPLLLKSASDGSPRRGALSLFFSVYNVRMSQRKKWTERLSLATQGNEDGGKCGLELLACGFLPLTTSACLINNGLHDVKLSYIAKSPSREFCEASGIDPCTLIVAERFDSSTLLRSVSSNVEDRDDDGTQNDFEEICADEPCFDTESIASGRPTDASVTSLTDSVSMSETSYIKQKSGDQMALQVRIVVHSSLHPQNATLSEFLQQEPGPPLSSESIVKELGPVLEDGHEGLTKRLVSVTSSCAERKLPDSEQKLLLCTKDITRSHLCSTSDLLRHLFRITSQLFRIVVFGTGEADIFWANPAAEIPLRVHSFASLLQAVENVTLHMAKHGVQQLDGKSGWNLSTMARIIALLFDETELFGPLAFETFDVDDCFVDPHDDQAASTPPTQKRKRHVRSNFELLNGRSLIAQANETNRHGGSSMDDFLFGLTSDSSKQGGVDFSKMPFQTLPANLSRAKLASVFAQEPPIDEKTASTTTSSDSGSSESDTSRKTDDIRIDSPADFQLALESGSSDDIFSSKGSRGSSSAGLLGFGGMKSGGRRWMNTLPTSLATIREDFDADYGSHGEDTGSGMLPEKKAGRNDGSDSGRGEGDSLDTEMILSEKKKSVKQMRVPKLSKDAVKSGVEPTVDDVITTVDTIKDTKGETIAASDDDIEKAGDAFLEALGESLGFSQHQLDVKNSRGEERGVGSTRHRKTRSRCSIDWTIPGEESWSGLGADVVDSKPSMTTAQSTPEMPEKSAAKVDEESISALEGERRSRVRFPSFADRLVALWKSSAHGGRWFPYAYEVIIMQWAALLADQYTAKEKGSSLGSGDDGIGVNSGSSFGVHDAEVMSRSKFAGVACAPVLFEIIKQSLGFRISVFVNYAASKGKIASTSGPPLVMLDKSLLTSLEQLISTVTDVCTSNRSFDSWEDRQTSIDVNDSVVRFLRDLFGLLDPDSVHRLIMVYFSRFVMMDGKEWQDRDSQIGLRCSWERTKLRLNAVTAFVRFPDFVRVNSPQMLNWGSWWKTAPRNSTRKFFEGILDQFQHLALQKFVVGEGSVPQPDISIPPMRPHWLAEMVIGICLAGTEHVEQSIQNRAASLLHELFWYTSQESMSDGTAALVASMYVSFIEKMLFHTEYLSAFPPKCQLRKDLLMCVVFVIQSAPVGLLGALWRKLCIRLSGKGSHEKYGGIGDPVFAESIEELSIYENQPKFTAAADSGDETHVLDLFGLLNLCLSTLEYEGCDEHAEVDITTESAERASAWRTEYLLSLEPNDKGKRHRRKERKVSKKSGSENTTQQEYSSSSSRKWQAHDGSFVIITAGLHIVREMHSLLESLSGGQSHLNPARRGPYPPRKVDRNEHPISPDDSYDVSAGNYTFSHGDTVVFVRAAASLYLHSLTLHESDIVLTKTLNASVELVKIFGIKIFLESVGDTLQHWMRVLTLHCGARRAELRVGALEFLEFILRLTWDSYGSFFRVRLPLLAVQTEVMERLVATAAARYYRDQRQRGVTIDYLSNGSAEASLAPLWRTLDRLHHQSASQNTAYRGALMRLAEKLKKLFRAYIAAHAIAFLKKARSPRFPPNDPKQKDKAGAESAARMQANRISVQRVVNASAGYSKQFLGFHGMSVQPSTLAHHEAVEDAFLAAAEVFSPTELPDHRVAWLRKLSEFHGSRKKFAEEATCHLFIHVTLKQAAQLHGSLWSNTPFLPWTDSVSNGVHIDGAGPTGDPDDFTSDLEVDDFSDVVYGRQVDQTSSFRRIFYRVANSMQVGPDDWNSGLSRKLFFGVTYASEYRIVFPWLSLREMEGSMVEEAESAGDLFSAAGIIESSRYAWNLASQYYADKFNYSKLAHVYSRLARTVVSLVPPIDARQQHECTVALGRFYRVWFHGGAPDELIGAEFIYRSDSGVRLEQFGKELRAVIGSIIPNNTPIHLVLDGRPDQPKQDNAAGFSRLGPTPLEPVRIKVTPLRPLIRKAARYRGLPEWFNRYIDTAFTGSALPRPERMSRKKRGQMQVERARGGAPRHREHARSYSASVFSSTGSTTLLSSQSGRRMSRLVHSNQDSSPWENELVGVDTFVFLQPNRHRGQAARDWWKTSNFAEKSIRVTQLQVAQCFPACVTRQAVIHRIVFTQSPLEAGVNAVCEWCTILFRTAVATNGMALLGINNDPGIGNDASKVVADCIHSSRVKEMGIALLKNTTDVKEEDDSVDVPHSYDSLSEEEVKKFQLKLARAIVVFMELLHLLIARNRDLLLDVIQERKRGEAASGPPAPVSYNRSNPGTSSALQSVQPENVDRRHRRPRSAASDSAVPTRGEDVRPRHNDNIRSRSQDDQQSAASFTSGKDGNLRTDSAIAVQSELQRAFISLAKALYPMVSGIMREETPRWLKQCCQDNYFSAYTYRLARMPIGEELCFFGGDVQNQSLIPESDRRFAFAPSDQNTSGHHHGSPHGSAAGSSVVSRGSEALFKRGEL